MPYTSWPKADRVALINDIKAAIDEEITARLGGNSTRVKDFYDNYLTNDYLVNRIALAVGGALPGVPSTGHNLPGAEGVINGHIDQAISKVLAALPNSSAPGTAPAIDVAALAAEVATAVRAELAKTPLKFEGSAS